GRPHARRDPGGAARRVGRGRRPDDRLAGAGGPGARAEKKSVRAAEQDRPDVSEARRLWRETAPALPAARLVFLDESGAKTDMARRYGRGPAGERVVAAVPAGHWRATTMVCAARLDGPAAPWVLEGAMDADGFAVYCAAVLAPALRPGDVVV